MDLNVLQKGKTCNYCHEQNHFKSVCRTKKRQKPIHNVEYFSDNNSEDSDSNSLHAFGLTNQKINSNSVNSIANRPTIKVQINGHSMKILIDTGSSINVLDENTFRQMKVKPQLSKSDTKVYAYGASSSVNLITRTISSRS
jgi:uncharacterized protein YaaN involved in tellurite resistance